MCVKAKKQFLRSCFTNTRITLFYYLLYSDYFDRWVTYQQHWWYCCNISDVLNQGHPSLCLSTSCSVHSRDGGPQWWSITARRWWVSSFCYPYLTKSSMMTSLLIGPFSLLLFSCIDQSPPIQKTTATRTELGILYIPPQQGSSMSVNFCFGILPSAGNSLSSFINLPHCISLPRELSINWLWSS